MEEAKCSRLGALSTCVPGFGASLKMFPLGWNEGKQADRWGLDLAAERKGKKGPPPPAQVCQPGKELCLWSQL